MYFRVPLIAGGDFGKVGEAVVELPEEAVVAVMFSASHSSFTRDPKIMKMFSYEYDTLPEPHVTMSPKEARPATGSAGSRPSNEDEKLKNILRSLTCVQAGWAFGVPEDGRDQWLDLVVAAVKGVTVSKRITEDMVTRASEILWDEAIPPAMADVRDFTDEEVKRGDLRKADKACARQNRDLVRRVLEAAMHSEVG